MLIQVLRYSILIILMLWAQQGSPMSVDELNAQHSGATIRQVKSEEMLKYMNVSADPCEDFYEYNCGNFAKYNPVDEEIPAIGIFETLAKIMETKIKAELKSDERAEADADEKVKNFYKSCIEVPNVAGVYVGHLKEILSEFGAMPAMEGDWWQESDFDWTETVAQMIHKTGQSVIIDISVFPDFTDNSINRLVFSAPELLLGGREYYVDDSFSSERESHIAGISDYLQTYLGVSGQSADETASEIMDFEIALAFGMNDDKLGIQITDQYILEDMDEVQRKYLPAWDSKKLINDAMGLIPAEVNVEKAYLENTMNVLARTPKRVVANYVFYKYLSMFLIDPEITESNLEEYCMTTTKKYFYKNLENLIYRKYFPPQAEEILYSMWRELKTTFRDILFSPRLDWIRADTKQHAIEKLKTLKMKILSYEHNEDVEEVAQLDLNDHDYVHNLDVLLTLSGNKARAKMTKPSQGLEMGADATTTPAYNSVENLVQVPVGFLLPYYLWSSSYPSVYNFANLGFFVAHEILHAFDDQGRHSDAKGNAREWWDTHTDSEFRKRSQYFVDQYKGYMYGGHYLPEMAAQGENIADNGGIRLAYEAYLNWYRKADQNRSTLDLESFSNFNYSHKQLFFISYGAMWCSNQHPSVLPQVLADTHAPNNIRAFAPLVNFDEFSNAFNCPIGSPMNPVKKNMIY